MSANAAELRDFADRIASYLTTRASSWKDEMEMREAVRETVRIVFTEALYETRALVEAAHE